VALLIALLLAAPTTRLKDLVTVQGMRGNELFGYGLVVGLPGTGDTEQTGFTQQSLSGMLGRFGTRIDRKDIHVRNVAAVMVTARLNTFQRPGTTLDASVSSLGNATSLAGGVLLITALSGPDGQVYAVAQGPVQVGGYDAEAAGSRVRKNQPTSGRVPGGATVEKAVTFDLSSGPLMLELQKPDATTASRIAAAVNKALGSGARAVDPATVEVKAPGDPVAVLASIEAVEVESDERARVVISERTGTVVAGEHVRLRPALVAHGGLTVSISQQPLVSQPQPFSNGTTSRARFAEVRAEEANGRPAALPATSTVDQLVKALGALGAAPRDLIAILQALKAAGALDADIEVI
jgi:flagellar P-ring protein precursor FlgI